MRVYEIAREVGLPNKELIAKIRALGLEVNNHMSSLDPDAVARVKRSLERERVENTVTKRLSSTVLRRRSKNSTEDIVVPAGAARDGNGQGARAAARERASVGQAAASSSESAAPSAPVTRRVVARQQEQETVRSRAAVSAEPEPRREPRVQAPPPVVREVPEPPQPAAEPPRPVVPPPAEPVAPEAAAPPVERAPEPPPRLAPPTPAIAAGTEPSITPPRPVVAEPPPRPPVERAPVTPPAAPGGKFVIQGPKVVDMPGRKQPERIERAPAPQPPPAEPPPMQTRVELVRPAEGQQRPVAEPGGRRRAEDLVGDARSRFEAELERARSQAAERERERAARRAAEVAPTGPREDGRPEVGSIISLPMTRIKITERGPSGRQMPGQGQVRGLYAQQQERGRRGARDIRKKMPKKGGKQTLITTPAEHKRIIRIEDTVAVADMAKHMGIKAAELLKKLWGMGMTGVNINASIDLETAQIVAGEFGYEVQNVAFKEDKAFETAPDTEEDLESRSPVVTVMGHVDHGKTSLLDHIRKARVAAGEAGGITQHIGAYRVSAGEGHGDIVFIDTPGHAAFTEMRARGAQATDLVILVVAANDGVMPQTLEALSHAKEAKVPIIVAVNKIDLPDAQPERVRQQLADHGLIAEEWGGDTMFINVSALKGENVDKLLESISLQAELLDLKANRKKPALGVVIESKLDRARGPMVTVLVQEGVLHVGDNVVVGEYMGRVRAILDDTGVTVTEAGPSSPVELLGIDGVPDAGEVFNVAPDEKMAKTVVEHRRQAKRKKELATTGKLSLENLMERIHEGATKELKVVLKADVHGSSEALKEALTRQSTDKVSVNVISAGVGGITESDVNLAKAGGAIIVGFHVRPAGKSAKLAEQEGVDIKLYDIIYEALDEVRAAMAGLLAPIKKEREMGRLEVRDTFAIPKRGVVAGCMVTSGRVTRRSLLRVIRDSVQVYTGRVGSLRRFKDEASEVKEGFECGLIVEGFTDVKVGDVVEAYEIIEEAATL
jgi:translation initiation factor IF-2